MRNVNLVVGGQRLGEALTWAYPKGVALGHFKTPVYSMMVSDVTDGGQAVSREFPTTGWRCTPRSAASR